MQNDLLTGIPQKKNNWIVPFILGFLLLISVAFAMWAFMGMMDYKNNSDEKSEVAVQAALAEQKNKLDAEYQEQSKSPFDSFTAGAEFGSMSLSFPKTWELYVDSNGSASSSSIDGYAHPNYVPGSNNDAVYALRFQVLTSDYATELKAFDSAIKSGNASISPYRPEKVQTVLGAKVQGTIKTNRTGVLYLFPLRDKTVKIWTESTVYSSDLDTVMQSLTFIP